jgi:hypothetical protein
MQRMGWSKAGVGLGETGEQQGCTCTNLLPGHPWLHTRYEQREIRSASRAGKHDKEEEEKMRMLTGSVLLESNKLEEDRRCTGTTGIKVRAWWPEVEDVVQALNYVRLISGARRHAG